MFYQQEGDLTCIRIHTKEYKREEPDITKFFPEWVQYVPGLSKDLENILTNEWLGVEDVVNILQEKSLITKREYHNFINKNNEEAYGRGETIYREDEIDEASRDDPKPISSKNTTEPRQDQGQQQEPRRQSRQRGRQMKKRRDREPVSKQREMSEEEKKEAEEMSGLYNVSSDRFTAKGLLKLASSLEQQARSAGGTPGSMSVPNWVRELEPSVRFQNRVEDAVQGKWQGKEDFIRRLQDTGHIALGSVYEEVMREVQKEKDMETHPHREERARRPKDRPRLNLKDLLEKEKEHIRKREGYDDDDYGSPEKTERDPGTLYEQNESGRTQLTEEGLATVLEKMKETFIAFGRGIDTKTTDLDMDWAKEVANLYPTLYDLIQKVKEWREHKGYITDHDMVDELSGRGIISQKTAEEYKEKQREGDNQQTREQQDGREEAAETSTAQEDQEVTQPQRDMRQSRRIRRSRGRRQANQSDSEQQQEGTAMSKEEQERQEYLEREGRIGNLELDDDVVKQDGDLSQTVVWLKLQEMHQPIYQ